jgi:streptogramin lyase
MERTDQPTPQPSPTGANPSGYTPDEIAAAAELRADARARIDDISARVQTATTPEEHTALGRESARAWGDYKAAGFILTDGAPSNRPAVTG